MLLLELVVVLFDLANGLLDAMYCPLDLVGHPLQPHLRPQFPHKLGELCLAFLTLFC
jgi:hypothetical protein